MQTACELKYDPEIVIKTKRAYEPAYKEDGYRVLIDRLWPRGIKKPDLPLDDWAKELAPSTGLRKSFGHEAGGWKDFRAKYQLELRKEAARAKIEILARRARRGTVTLIYSARDKDHNNAVVLKSVLDRSARNSTTPKKASRKAA